MKAKRLYSALLALLTLIYIVPLNVFPLESGFSENDLLNETLSNNISADIPSDNVSTDISASERTSENSSDPLITVKNSYGKAGETVTVDIVLNNNPGIMGLTLKLQYDESVLVLKSVENGSSLGDMTFTAPNADSLRSGCLILWDTDEVDDNRITDGAIATLTFQISDNAEENTTLAISAVCVDALNKNSERINISSKVGKFNVLSYMPGDVNDDGRITTTDVAYLRRYIVGSYNVTINEAAADVNNDGMLTSTDVVFIRRYIAGGYGVEFVPSTIACTHDTLIETEEKAPTCTEDGNVAYWTCFNCGKYFADKICSSEISDVTVKATGHNLQKVEKKDSTFTEEGNIEYWYCGACNGYFSDSLGENAITYNDTIIAPKIAYTINYSLYDNSEYLEKVGVENENPAYYDSSVGLKLKNLKKTGYVFEGWFDGDGSNAEQIKEIAVGTTEEIDLYARWTPIEYSITYIDAAVHTNPETYTIEDNITLSDPEWSGLAFSYWTDNSGKINTFKDSNGNYKAKIEEGTTGKIELKANWGRRENYAVSENQVNSIVERFDPETGLHYFAYKIGTIYNVVLDSLDTRSKTKGQEISYEINETVRLEDSVANTASETISNSLSNTTEWSTTKETIEGWSNTTSLEVGTKVSAEAKIKKIVKLSAERSVTVGASGTKDYSNATTTMTGGSSTGTSEQSRESSCTVAFNQAVEKSFTITDTISADMPAGEYSYVYCVDVEVFVGVIYDPETGDYNVDTYSIMGSQIKSMISYKLSPDSNITVEENSGLVCNLLSIEELKTYMDNAYYVSYDANGGEGEMYSSGHIRGESHTLSENQFTKEGYIWNGWKLENGKIVFETDKVSDLAEKGEVVIAKAQWTPIVYAVKYDGNGSTSGEMSNSSFTYDKEGELSQNKFYKTGYTFEGWSMVKDGEIMYSDKETVCNLTAQSGVIVTLYAVWEANTYTVTYDANDGEGTTAMSTHTYDIPSPLSENGFTRGEEYAFLGWSEEKAALTPTYLDKDKVLNLASSGNVTLYAVWVKIGYTVNVSGLYRNITNNDNNYVVPIIPEMDREALKANGYTKLELDFSFKGRATKPITFHTPRLQIFSCTDKELYNGTHNAFEGMWGSWTWRYVHYSMSINEVTPEGGFWIRWSTSGGSGGDGWCLEKYIITVKASK